MFDQDNLTAALKLTVIQSADVFAGLREDVKTAKGAFVNRVAEAVVGRLLASDAETVAGASRWVGDILKDHPAQSTANAYRSALKWALTSDTVARLRSMVTPEAATDATVFATVAIAAADSLGDYWAAYKADKKKAKPEPAPAQGTLGVTVPAAEPDFTGKPEADPVLSHLTAALAAIDALNQLDATEALEMVRAVLAGEMAVADALAA